MRRSLAQFLSLSYWDKPAPAAAHHLHDAATTSGRVIQVVTVNAEMLLHALKYPVVGDIILRSDFFVADTMSVAWWLRCVGKRVYRIPGVDLAHTLVTQAQPHTTVAILGGSSDGVRSAAAAYLTSLGATVVYHAQGPQITSYNTTPMEPWLSELIAKKPKIIFIAFGHGKQEWWGSELKRHLDFPAIIVGVGGAIDMWGGKTKRAPAIMRKLGLEWLWRLILEPRRLPRILAATVIFPYRALRDTLL